MYCQTRETLVFVLWEAWGSWTYIFHAKELITSITSYRPSILQHLLQGCEVRLWFRIFLVLARGGGNAAWACNSLHSSTLAEDSIGNSQ